LVVVWAVTFLIIRMRDQAALTREQRVIDKLDD